MAAQRRVHPALGKEDIARALDLAKHHQAWLDMFDRRGRPQRMMQIAQTLEHPGFMAPIRDICERREPRVALGGIRRERRTYERELRLAIRILRPLVLPIENGRRPADVPDRELLREPDV